MIEQPNLAANGNVKKERPGMAADEDRKRAAGRLASFVFVGEGCQAWRRWGQKRKQPKMAAEGDRG